MRWNRWLIGLLLLVAVLLGLNLVGPYAGDMKLLDQALAQNRATVGGDYVVAAARTSTSVQVLYVVDTRLKKLVVYGAKRGGRGGFNVVDVKDLNREFPNGCSGQILMLPFALADRAEGVAVVDTVNKKMIVYVTYNYGRLSIVASQDLARDMGS